MTLSFFCHGEPATAGSKRAFIIPGKDGREPRAIVTDTCARGKPWRAAIQAAALDARAAAGASLFTGALRVTLTFILPRPVSKRSVHRYPFPITRPDIDKLSRAVLDALRHIVWVDDAQVVSKVAVKRYQDRGRVSVEDVGVRVRIEPEPPAVEVAAEAPGEAPRQLVLA